ncbi:MULTISPECIES: replication initiator [unclassified Streptomyces]|uniref:replication initiator n=1 Tax=unclassified Streptomyces TaxID=2593676 RepID=UPI0037BC3798
MGERLSVRCRNRLAAVCVPCSRLRAGTPSTSSSPASWAVRTPPAVGDRRRLFVILTAPAFGPVHRSGERRRPAAKQPTANAYGLSAAAACTTPSKPAAPAGEDRRACRGGELGRARRKWGRGSVGTGLGIPTPPRLGFGLRQGFAPSAVAWIVPVALGGVEPVASVEFCTDAAGVFVVFTSVAHDQPNAAPRPEQRARMGSRRPCNTPWVSIRVCPVLLTARCLGPPATDTSDSDRERGPFRARRRTAPNVMPQNAGTPRRRRIRAMRGPGRASRVQRCPRLTRHPAARACPAGTLRRGIVVARPLTQANRAAPRTIGL